MMFVVYGLVFVITLAILFIATMSKKETKSPMGMRFVIIAGIVFPVIILVIMLIFELRISKKLSHNEVTQSGLQVQVIGHGWWFEVVYPQYDIIDANEIHIPIDQDIVFILTSKSMIHSFWVPRLGGKRDQLPDHPNKLILNASSPGIYHGVCAEYCAGQHARMAFRLVAHKPDEFQHWIDRYKQAPVLPQDPDLLQGRLTLNSAGCLSCHAITGLSDANTGPNLTHIGSRLTIGAGQFENNKGTLSGWITNSQALKPGNLMPDTYVPPGQLHQLVNYLRSLK
jgi:cytochrome c oxidase subunit 2